MLDLAYSRDRCWRLSQSEVVQPPNDPSASTSHLRIFLKNKFGGKNTSEATNKGVSQK